MELYRSQIESLLHTMRQNVSTMKAVQDELVAERSKYFAGEMVNYRDVRKKELRSRILLKKNREIAATITAVSYKIENHDDFPGLSRTINYRGDHQSDTVPSSLPVDSSLQFDITFRNTGLSSWEDPVKAEVLVENWVTGYMDIQVATVPAGTVVNPRETITFSFDFGVIGTIGNYQVQAHMTKDDEPFEPAFRKNLFITN